MERRGSQRLVVYNKVPQQKAKHRSQLCLLKGGPSYSTSLEENDWGKWLLVRDFYASCNKKPQLAFLNVFGLLGIIEVKFVKRDLILSYDKNPFTDSKYQKSKKKKNPAP